jgi:serine/threonine-protein kinase RsbW
MENGLEGVSPMVLRLKAEAEGSLELEALVRFEICMTEALSNLTMHADTRDRTTPIDIALAKSGASVGVEIFDPVGTKPFDLKDHAVALSDVELTAESGRGLGLILECADSVTYGPSHGRNRLALTFQKRETDA